MDLFIGKQECAVDEKRRFSLPPKYRPLFGADASPSGYTHQVVVLPWYGGALAVLPLKRWEEIETRLLLMEYTTPDFLEAKRQCLSRMEYARTDPESRLLLSADHHVWLRLNPKGKDKLMAVGVGQHLELWNASEWAEVERTGKNPASRPAADVEFDKKLEVLMRAALEQQERVGAAGARADESTGGPPDTD